jgi:hypothetical protein
MNETSPFVASLIIWARHGGYSTIIIYALSFAIMIIAFVKRAMMFAYTFLAIVIIMTGFLVGFQCSTSMGMNQGIIHLGQIAKILPYLLILYILLKVKRPEIKEK